MRATTGAQLARVVAETVAGAPAEGRLAVPVHATFPLERAQEAYDAFAEGGKFGKLVLVM